MIGGNTYLQLMKRQKTSYVKKKMDFQESH